MWVPQISGIVHAQFLDIGNVDPSPFNDNQPFLRELVQDTREVLLRQIESVLKNLTS